MLRPPGACVVGLSKDTHLFQPSKVSRGHHSKVASTMNKPVPARRVIFPTLYDLAPSVVAAQQQQAPASPSLPAIPEDPTISPTSICELPALSDEEAARIRIELEHLLTLSPLTSSRTPRPRLVLETTNQSSGPTLPLLPFLGDKSSKPTQVQVPPRTTGEASREETHICLSPPQLSLERKLRHVPKEVRTEMKRTHVPVPPIPKFSLSDANPKAPQEPVQVLKLTPKQRSILPNRITPSPLRRIPREDSPEQAPKQIVKPPRSILRSKSWSSKAHTTVPEVEKVSSVSSDLPSLASSETQSSLEEAVDEDEDDTTGADGCGAFTSPPRRYRSEPPSMFSPNSRGGISFDPHIWVREFERTDKEREAIWYTPEEMGSFKMEALNRILTYESSEIIPTGTGRMIQRPVLTPKTAFFSHPSLRVDGNERLAEKGGCVSGKARFREAVLENEIRRILVVDPHDIILKLFSKTLRIAMPMVSVTTAKSSEEAIRHIEQSKKRFDIIIVEERLGLFRRPHHGANYLSSGSMLIKRLAAAKEDATRKSLFVGISAHLHKDEARLRDHGADLCWPKPPPPLDRDLMDEILRLLLKKRGRTSAAQELFGG